MNAPLLVTTVGVTAGTQVFTGTGVLGMAILNAAAAAATLSCYDGTSASDQRIFYVQAGANLTEGFAGGRLWFTKGLFVVTTGAGSESQVGIE